MKPARVLQEPGGPGGLVAPSAEERDSLDSKKEEGEREPADEDAGDDESQEEDGVVCRPGGEGSERLLKTQEHERPQ